MEKLRALAALLGHNLSEFLIAIDQGLNVLVATITLRRGWSDETLSAHCWRSYSEGKVWGRLFMPPIDWLFSWQALTPVFLDAAGSPITGHCRRAFEKERARSYLPPEYRQ